MWNAAIWNLREIMGSSFGKFHGGWECMRVIVSLSLPPYYLYKREKVLKDYLKEKLELEYAKAVKHGLGRKVYGLYISTAKAIEEGKRDLALKLLDVLHGYDISYSDEGFEFGGELEYKNCALVSLSEDFDLFFYIGFVEKEKIKKIYYSYDKTGKFIPQGALLDADVIENVYKNRFMAVA